MSEFIIVTDSTVDLGAERMKALGVPFTMLSYKAEDKDYFDDMSDDNARAVYRRMREGAVIVTSQVNVDAFLEQWTPYLEQGKDILYVGFSSGLSGTCNSGRVAAEQLREKYPARKLYALDSLCASGGEGMFLEYVLRKQASGASFEECCEYGENLKLRINHWFTVSELTYLRRGGRVGAVAATFADMLNIKPVMNMDDAGHLIPREKVRGRKGALKRMVEHMAELLDPEDNEFFNITHGDCIEDAEYVKKLVQELAPGKPVNISYVGTVIGAHSGPGTVALFFVGKPRTK